MKPWVRIDEAAAPDGTRLVLQSRDGEFLLLADGKPLMSSDARLRGRARDARLPAHLRAVATPCVLIGGLGMGFTLRAALDAPATGRDRRRRRAGAGGRGLESRARSARSPGIRFDDPRVRVEETDVAIAVRRNPGKFDAVLLDVDNGSDALTTSTNGWLYGDRGVDALRASLTSERRPRDVAGGRGQEVRAASAPARVHGRWSSTCAAG